MHLLLRGQWNKGCGPYLGWGDRHPAENSSSVKPRCEEVSWLAAVPEEVREGLTREVDSLELELEESGQVSKMCECQEGLSKQGQQPTAEARGITAKPGDFCKSKCFS